MAHGFTCPGCRARSLTDDLSDGCPDCIEKYPPVLLKAAIDPFTYAVRLVTGEVWEFGSCAIYGDWIHLSDVKSTLFPLERGVDVQLSAIVWVADAPSGS